MRIACRELPGWFGQKSTIVVPTPFLSGVAREQFARTQLKLGLETWERSNIYSLEAWLVSCWKEARYSVADVPSLLSLAQERALWYEIIQQEHPNLFDVAATVRLARSAASLMEDWIISSQSEAWNDHADALQFRHWRNAFRKKCQKNAWVTRADLPRFVADWISAGKIHPSLSAFVGFETISPALAGIFTALGGSAVCLPFDHTKPTTKSLAKGFDTLPEELDFAARRLRLMFEENQNQMLALFVPELAKHHSLVERTLHAIFFPSTATRLTAAQPSVGESLFRLSEGGLLMDHPIVAAALLLLSVACPRIDHADAGAILRCPFIRGAHAEQNPRAVADIELRKQRELDVAFRDIEKVSRSCPILSVCWPKITNLIAKTSQLRAFSEWSELIADILAALGWPGDQELNPFEDRVIEQWNHQLSELSSLGLVSAETTFESAVAQLRRLLSIPLERGRGISPIQVLDASLAVGLEFDRAIAVGLSEETWPPATRILPLIPLKLQPPKSVRGERVRKTQALFESSPDVLVTFASSLTSLAFKFVAKKTKDAPIWQGKRPIDSFSPQTLEQQRDGQAPGFVAGGDFRGGTSVIKAQSQCPFQAFAKYRLHARRPEDASFGFDALDRGNFVHKALELVWKRLYSLQNLRQMNRDDLNILIKTAIDQAVKISEEGPLHQLSVTTERERLQEVILDWLDVERERQQDFTVETTEEKQVLEVPGLKLNIRLDRIDRLSNGNLVLIDYKSGKQSKPKLDTERPEEPQLLVYAAAVGPVVDGVFFGQLKPREVKAVGYSRTKQFGGRSVDVKKDWDGYMKSSRENVHKLAAEFVRGVAEVRPNHSPCEYCGMKPFCRVNEKDLNEEGEE